MPKKNITRADLQNAINSPQASSERGAKIGNSMFFIRVTLGSVRIYDNKGEEQGIIKGGVTSKVGKVETINTKAYAQGMGIGKLMAAAFYEICLNQGATHVQLGTTDTSGGFWPYLGVAQAKKTAINDAVGKIFPTPSSVIGIGK